MKRNRKKRNRDNCEKIISRKQYKMDSNWISKSNTFEGLEEKLDDIKVNARKTLMEKIIKHPPISIAKVDNFSSLSQLL